MRTLTPTLLTAQKQASRTPFVKLTISNQLHGVLNLRWQRLYTGIEPEGPHALTLAEDGSLLRFRITPPEDNRKLYLQRVDLPDENSDFTQWTYLNQYGVVNCAACSLGSEVSLFWTKSDGEIDSLKSLDNGQTWQSLEFLGYSPTGAVSGVAAAYRPNGDLALFFTDGPTLYVIQRLEGEWQDRAAWDKSVGGLTGVASLYDGDWKLVVCGTDVSGNARVWSLVYGDGAEVPAGAWSNLKELASAPAGSGYQFGSVFLDNPDSASSPPLAPSSSLTQNSSPSPSPETYNLKLITYDSSSLPIYRCFFVEKFDDSESDCTPFWSHTLPQTAFLDNRWLEPAPCQIESALGLSMAHSIQYAWLSSASGVWRASLAEETLDLTQDVLSVQQISESIPPLVQSLPGTGSLTVELLNHRGQYSLSLSPTYNLELNTFNSPSLLGFQIALSPGYRTSAGYEISAGQTFTVQSFEFVNAPGKASLILHAEDAWSAVAKWTARSQFRFNQPDAFGDPTSESSVQEILAQVLARAGLKLEIISHSASAAGFFPDFTIHPGETGRPVITRLLSFIPDLLFVEGNTAYLSNPLPSDESVYSFVSFSPTYNLELITHNSPPHPILEGRYTASSFNVNRIRVEGSVVTADCSAWNDISNQGVILQEVSDLNLTTGVQAMDRGAAILRHAEMASQGGFIRVPANCGQQLLDVIEITDPKTGLIASKRRVLGISFSYFPYRAEYQQKLFLGAP